ncbi:putative proteasome assembly chaperone 1, ODA1/CCDC63 family [Plasmopara halstedii]
MALALRFAEEGEFRSRACDTLSYDAPDVPPSKVFFRWSRPVREHLGSLANDPVKTKTVIIAMPGASQQFVQHLTANWIPVGTLVTSDQIIHPWKLQPGSSSKASMLLSRTKEEIVDTLVMLLGSDVPVASTWNWLKSLLQHVAPHDIVCLDSQLSTIYSNDGEEEAKLRMLASSCVTKETITKMAIQPLEIPQFVSGIPAALLTHGELRKCRVQVFLSLRNVSCTPIDVIESFQPLLTSIFQDMKSSRSWQRDTLSNGSTFNFSLFLTCRVFDQMARQEKARPERQFDTRFLPDDGIPEYNALFDNQLGTRRKYLLGNREALALMQQTGVIDHIEAKEKSSHQYIVHITEKKGIGRRKRLPFRSTSNAINGLIQSNSDLSTSAKSTIMSGEDIGHNNIEEQETCGKSVCKTRERKFEMVTTVPSHKRRHDVRTISCTMNRKLESYKHDVTSRNIKGTLEHLLESDAAFLSQIQTMNDQLVEFEKTRMFLMTEIHHLRQKLRGVNAVRENDEAVAHCSSIMQHRIIKAEEEYMKLLTQQQEMKKQVDRIRHEVLTLRKVRQKLQEDSEQIRQLNQMYDEKIQGFQNVRTQLLEECHDLEHRSGNKVEIQEQVLASKVNYVVDVAKLMDAVKARNKGRRRGKGLGSQQSTAALTLSVGKGKKVGIERQKTWMNYTCAFHNLQATLNIADVRTFEEQFLATQEHLLSKFQANLTLGDEITALENEISRLETHNAITCANTREDTKTSEKIEQDLQTRVQKAFLSIKSYNQLRTRRNREHLKLREVILRALDTLQVEIYNTTNVPTSNLLELLQSKMTELVTLVKENYMSSSKWDQTRTFSIVLGPQAPAGSALTAIRRTVQPPSVESAIALTENISFIDVMHGLHRAVSPKQRRERSISLATSHLNKSN